MRQLTEQDVSVQVCTSGRKVVSTYAFTQLRVAEHSASKPQQQQPAWLSRPHQSSVSTRQSAVVSSAVRPARWHSTSRPARWAANGAGRSVAITCTSQPAAPERAAMGECMRSPALPPTARPTCAGALERGKLIGAHGVRVLHEMKAGSGFRQSTAAAHRHGASTTTSAPHGAQHPSLASTHQLLQCRKCAERRRAVQCSHKAVQQVAAGAGGRAGEVCSGRRRVCGLVGARRRSSAGTLTLDAAPASSPAPTTARPSCSTGTAGKACPAPTHRRTLLGCCSSRQQHPQPRRSPWCRCSTPSRPTRGTACRSPRTRPRCPPRRPGRAGCCRPARQRRRSAGGWVVRRRRCWRGAASGGGGGTIELGRYLGAGV